MSDMVRISMVLILILLLSVFFLLYARSRIDLKKYPLGRISGFFWQAWLHVSAYIGFGMDMFASGRKRKEREEAISYNMEQDPIWDVYSKI